MSENKHSTDIRISFKECRSLTEADYNVTLIAPGVKYEKKMELE